MGEHYSPEEIAEGLSSRLPTRKSKEILRHLLRGCRECLATAQQERPLVALRQKRDLSQELSSAYNVSLNRAEELARRTAYLPLRERVRFRKALALLEVGNTVLALVDGDLELNGLGVYEALLVRSWDRRYESPREMCHLARTAVQVAHRLESETYGPWRVSDYLARAWGELANALRVGDQFRESEEAFGTAFEFFAQGSQDRRILMRLLDLEASLLGTRREFSLALERLSFLSKLYHEAGERHMSGRALITKALYLYYKGDTHEASDTLAEGLGLIDKDRDPSLMVVSSLNQLLLLVECGRFKEARKFLFKNRGRLSGAGSTLLMRLRWTEGLISYGLGELESAEISFREVKKSSAELGLEFACALAELDLTLTLMRQGRIEEAIQEGLASTEAFVRLSIHREILGSVILLHENFQAKTASLSLIETTVRYLRKRQVELNLK
jgi:tetratricopeptide (TPR) repeat protein